MCIRDRIDGVPVLESVAEIFCAIWPDFPTPIITILPLHVITALHRSSKDLSSLINTISSGEISGKIAKSVFEIMVETGKDQGKIIKEKGLKQQSDPKEIEKLIIKVLQNNSEKVSEYKSGKEKLYGFFIGEIMKASSGKANPKLVNDILKKKLNKWPKALKLMRN